MMADVPRDVGGIGAPQGPEPRPRSASRPPAADFARILKDKLGAAPPPAESAVAGLKFSSHARERMAQRGIDLSPEDLRTLAGGLAKARAKGSREALVLMRDLGFIVSVSPGVVVTAMDSSDLKDRVFTQIDSTIIV